MRKDKRQHAEYHRKRSHQDRTQANLCRRHCCHRNTHALAMALRSIFGKKDCRLCQKADEHNKSRLHINIVLQAPHTREKETAKQSKRYTHDDSQRNEQTLIKSTENKINEDYANGKHNGSRVAQRSLLSRHAAKLITIALRQHSVCRSAYGLQCLATTVTVGSLSHHRNAAEQIKAIQALTAIDALHGDVLRNGNHLTTLAANTHVGKRILVETELGRCLHNNTIEFRKACQVTAVRTTHIAGKNLEHCIRRHTIALATGSIHLYTILRILCVERGKRTRNGRFAIERINQFSRHTHQVLYLSALTVLHMKFKTTGGTITRNHGAGADTYLGLRNIGSTTVDFIYHRIDVVAFTLALIPILQTDIKRTCRRRLVEC